MCVSIYTKGSQPELDLETVRTILGEYRIHCADVHLKGPCTTDDLVDVIEGNRTYIPVIYVRASIELDLPERHTCTCACACACACVRVRVCEREREGEGERERARGREREY